MKSMATTNPRRLRSAWLLMALAAVVAAIAIAVAAEVLHIDSAWSAEAPTIDGKLTDWSSPLVTLGSTPVSLGVRNDGESLYVALASSEQATRMMLGAAGFTVWFDPAGKDKKSFGITVPPTMTGGPGMRGRGPGGPPPDQSGQPPAETGQEGGPAGPKGPALAAITSIEVLGPGKDDKRRLELAYATDRRPRCRRAPGRGRARLRTARAAICFRGAALRREVRAGRHDRPRHRVRQVAGAGRTWKRGRA